MNLKKKFNSCNIVECLMLSGKQKVRARYSLCFDFCQLQLFSTRRHSTGMPSTTWGLPECLADLETTFTRLITPKFPDLRDIETDLNSTNSSTTSTTGKPATQH